MLTRMVIVTGKPLRELGLADFDDYAAARRACGRKVAAVPMAYDLLRAAGGLEDLPPTLRQARSRGQLSVAELVDRYPVANTAIRDVLVYYLVERSAAPTTGRWSTTSRCWWTCSGAIWSATTRELVRCTCPM